MLMVIPIDKFCFQTLISEALFFPQCTVVKLQGPEYKRQMKAPFTINKAFVSCTPRLRGTERMQEPGD